MEKHESDNASVVSSQDEDHFDDAQEMTPRPSSANQGRSLVGGRTPSVSETSQKESSSRPTSAEAFPTYDDSTADKEAPPSSEPKKPDDRPESSGGADGVEETKDTETKHKSGELQDAGDGETAEDKSPLLTTHRVSISTMDDVNLEGGEKSPDPNRSSAISEAPKVPPRDSTASLASVSPDPVPSDSAPSKSRPTSENRQAPPARKITSPFSWLARNKDDKRTSSPPTNRSKRDTVSSVNTIGSNPDLMVSHLEGNEESATSRPANRSSLRDRFKFLRMREEAGITSLDEESIPVEQQQGSALAGLIGRTTSFGLAIGTPTHSSDEKHDSKDEAGSPGVTSPSLARQPTVNMSLAPGTVSGMTIGPAGDEAPPVDWDLWQNVVYEGPQAVARTSPEELNQAIAGGIPQAIRGVVWQVMAQSKDDDLEAVYRELVVRGTDKEKPMLAQPKPPGSHPNGTPVNGVKGKESNVTSSRSSMRSIRSSYSTPATTAGTAHAPGSPPIEEETPNANANAENMEEVEAKLQQEKEKKAKDTVAIQKLEKVIKRDLGARTSYSKYIMSAGLQDGLFGICKAYALYDEAVGYAQGMNFIAMPLLFNMPEEEAFTLFARLMTQYGLREMFIQDMPGLHLHLYQFARLLEDFEPALYCHLHRRSVHPQLYATQWFLTLFAYRFPLQLVLRIYDLILSEGLEGAILKFGIVLMQKNAQALMGMNDMSQLTTFLKEKLFDVYIDKSPSANSILESGFFGSTSGVDKEIYRADMLVQDACSVKITPEMLKTYTMEWEEQRATEKERETELESLRSSVHHLTGRVRVLEDSLTKSDTEHAAAATELVRTKVENQELSDQNDSLKGQVEELKKIVDTQPVEVEERLKDEMDRVMNRNVEVQGANRVLEDQMAEMEKDLVDTKMQYAQIHSEYETLKQRWNNVSNMLQGQ